MNKVLVFGTFDGLHEGRPYDLHLRGVVMKPGPIDIAVHLTLLAGLYGAPQDTAWGGSALPVLVTISGAPSVGSGFAIVLTSFLKKLMVQSN